MAEDDVLGALKVYAETPGAFDSGTAAQITLFGASPRKRRCRRALDALPQHRGFRRGVRGGCLPAGLMSLPRLERDLLATAANELAADGTGPRAPYSDELPPAGAGQD